MFFPSDTGSTALFNNLLWGSPDTEDEQPTARRRVQTVMRDQKIKAAIDTGKTAKEISDETGFSLQAVYRALRREGVPLLIGAPRPRRRPKTDRNAQIIEKYKNGASAEQIGSEYGITRERICQILRPHNLTNIKAEQKRIAREFVEAERSKIVDQIKSTRAGAVAEAVAIVRNGGSRNDAVRRTGLPVHVVHSACNQAGLPHRHGRWAREIEFQKRMDLIRTMRAEGKLWNEIGHSHYSWAVRNMPEIIGAHPKKTRGVATVKAAASAAPIPPAPDVWTPEKVATLCRMYFDGCSAQQIADVLGEGFTRNSVIGKSNRLRAAKQLLPVTAT